MTLEEKKHDLLERLEMLPTDQDRFVYVVDSAKKQTPLPAECKTDDFRVEGCLSNLWFVPEFRDGKCFFRTDGDSQVVKAIAGLLSELYSGHPPEEILRMDPSFLGQVGITQHLSPNRRNGLSRLWAKIRDFAVAHVQPDAT